MRASDPSVVLPPVRYWCQYGIQCVARNARAFPRVGFHLIHGAGWSMAAGGAVEGRASAYRPCGAWRAVSSCRVDRRRAWEASGQARWAPCGHPAARALSILLVPVLVL